MAGLESPEGFLAAVGDLRDVWNRDGNRRLRETFESRTSIVEDATELLAPVLEPARTELPECCRTCYRIVGV
ncbi:MAG: hypothetical protein JRN06_00375 [Nitrososphaerota archaeon]|nr:hypothetical protein [Nitrososphaerota archaeon]MDG7023692.1 hypothetical protein [Nitrososphaerota archaeon]